MIAFAYLVVFLVTPAIVLWMVAHWRIARWFGTVILCYGAGLWLSVLGLVPETVFTLQRQLADLCVALALPLLLFSLDIRQWGAGAGKALLSMFLACASVVTLASTLFFVFREMGVESASHFAAMSIGVHTGGTPNLAAIQSGLGIPHSEYLVFHSLDTLVGTGYLLAMLTFGIPLFRLLLHHTVPPGQGDSKGGESHDDSLFDDDYTSFRAKGAAIEIAKPMALAVMVVLLAKAFSLIASQWMGSEASSAVMIVAITSMGIGLSLLPGIQALRFAYKIGMYLIYVFCFVVASIASMEQLIAVDWRVAAFLFCALFGSVALHCFLCRLLKIDADTFVITSVAAICSPPLVPMVARALGNPTMILAGMTAGILGYAVGNYLGISLGLLLGRF